MTNFGVVGAPSYASWSQTTGGNTYSYWIASNQDLGTYPSEQAMNDVWNSGVSFADFFLGNKGWAMPIAYWIDGIADNGDDYTCTTITNQTSQLLIITGQPNEKAPNSQVTLYPNGSARFHDDTVNDGPFEYIIYNLAQSTTPIASFTVSQSNPALEGGTPSVSNIKTTAPYSLSTPICNQASFGLEYSGAVQITIYNQNPASST
jgi:hypothetical protein